MKKKKVTEGTTGIASALMFKWITEGLFSNKLYFKHKNGEVDKALKYKGPISAVVNGALIGSLVPGLGTVVGGVGGHFARKHHENKMLTLKALDAKSITKEQYKKLKMKA